MNFADEMRSVADRLIDLLDECHEPYFVMGGLAIPIWGAPRATLDIDITLAADGQRLDSLLRLAAQRGFRVDEAYAKGFRDVLAGMRKLRLLWWSDLQRQIDIDLFLISTPYQRACFERRVKVDAGHRWIWVITPADLILHKLLAHRAKDLADIENVVLLQGLPEREYLEHWAAELGISDRLQSLLTRYGS